MDRTYLRKKINTLSRERLLSYLRFYKLLAYTYAGYSSSFSIKKEGCDTSSSSIDVARDFGNALNYRRFDTRLLYLKYNLKFPSTLKFFSYIFRSFFIFFALTAFFTILFLAYMILDNGLGYGIWELGDVQQWPAFSAYFASISLIDRLEELLTFLFSSFSSVYDVLYRKLLHYVEFWAFGWERVVEIAGEKYLVKRPLHDLLADLLLTHSYVTLGFIAGLIILQMLLVYAFFSFLLRISDSWNILLNLSQPRDWDLFFLNVEPLNQILDLDLYDFKKQAQHVNNFLYYYRLGFIDNEFNYYNTLDRLLATSRVTFLGYRGFLNLFPTKNVIFDVERFFKRKLVKFHVKNFIVSRYLPTARVTAAFQKLNLNKLMTLQSAVAKNVQFVYSILSERLFTRFRVLNLASFSWNNIFSWLTNFKGRHTLLGDWRLRDQLKKFRAIKADVVLSDDDSLDERNVIDLTPLQEDDIYNWYERELEFVTTHSFFHLHFRNRQFVNFKHGLSNMVGDYAFFSKEINYHAEFEHEYPDVTAPFFEVEDTISPPSRPTPFDTISELDEEEFVEEEDIEYPDHYYFEDGFLHIDEEDFDMNEEIEEEDIQELLIEDPLMDPKTIMERGEEFRDYDIERDELREDIFDMVGIKLNVKRDYSVTTTSSDYEGKAGLEIGTAFNYREGVYDTIYDDLVDFFWLNSDEGALSWFNFARGRFFFHTPVVSRRRRKHLIKFRLVAKRLHYAYSEYVVNQFLERIPFFISSYFYVIFFLFAIFFLVFFSSFILEIDFPAGTPFTYIFALSNFLILGFLLLCLLVKVFRFSFFRTVLHIYSDFASSLALIYLLFYDHSVLLGTPRPRGSIYISRHNRFMWQLYKFGLSGSVLEYAYFLRENYAIALADSIVGRTVGLKREGTNNLSFRTWWAMTSYVSAHSAVNNHSLVSLNNFAQPPHLFSFSNESCNVRGVVIFLDHYFPARLSPCQGVWTLPPHQNCFGVGERLLLHQSASGGPRTLVRHQVDQPADIFSRFFFASLKNGNSAITIFDASNISSGDSTFTYSGNDFSTKFTRLSTPGKRKIYKNLEPRVGISANRNLGLSEVSRLFFSQSLLDRVYSEQVGGAHRRNVLTETLFYANVFGPSTRPFDFDFNYFASNSTRSFYRD